MKHHRTPGSVTGSAIISMTGLSIGGWWWTWSLVLVGLIVGFAGCSARRATMPTPADVSRPNTLGAGAVTSAALALRGTPYRAGGDSPEGFDCSGFTSYVFGLHGVALPRRTQDQYAMGTRVRSVEDLEPGDLVFFTTVASGPSHVGLALEGDRFIHAPSERGRVRVEQLSTRYWSRRFIGARRVLP